MWLDDQEDLMVVRNSSAANKKEFFKIMISNELPLVMDEKTDLEPTNYALKMPIFLSLYLILKNHPIKADVAALNRIINAENCKNLKNKLMRRQEISDLIKLNPDEELSWRVNGDNIYVLLQVK